METKSEREIELENIVKHLEARLDYLNEELDKYRTKELLNFIQPAPNSNISRMGLWP